MTSLGAFVLIWGKVGRWKSKYWTEVTEYGTIAALHVFNQHFSIGSATTLSPLALEAAHIYWQQAGGPDTEMNGLTPCVLHQRLFDRGAFTLSKQLQFMVSDEANGSAGFREWKMRYHGEKLSFPKGSRTSQMRDT